MEKPQPNFGIRVRQLRLDKNLSQLELAELTELSESQISSIERGRSWVGELTIALLARALAVPQQALFDFTQNDAFLREGGQSRRALGKKAVHIVKGRR